MATIWKYPLIVGEQDIEMPLGAEIIYVDNQFNHITIWARVQPEANKALRRLVVAGTGHNVSQYSVYLGSCQMSGGAFVWHVFEEIIQQDLAS